MAPLRLRIVRLVLLPPIALSAALLAGGQEPPSAPSIPEAETVPAPATAEGDASDHELRSKLGLKKVGFRDDDLVRTRLLKEMHDSAVEEIGLLLTLIEFGHYEDAIFDQRLPESVDRLTRARRELAADDAQRLAALETALAVHRYVESMIKLRYDEGVDPQYRVLQARGRRIDAELALGKAKEAPAPSPAARK